MPIGDPILIAISLYVKDIKEILEFRLKNIKMNAAIFISLA